MTSAPHTNGTPAAIAVNRTVAFLSGEDDSFEAIRARFETMSEDEIENLVEAGLQMHARTWVMMALAIDWLEKKGRNMDRVRASMGRDYFDWLRRIGSRQLDARLCCKFWQNPIVIRMLGKLPAQDQAKLAADDARLPVLVPDDEGGRTTRLYTIEEIVRDGELRRQVFDNGHIRTDDQQATYLDRKRREAARPKPDKFGPFTYDPARDVAIFHGRKGDAVDRSTIQALATRMRRSC